MEDGRRENLAGSIRWQLGSRNEKGHAAPRCLSSGLIRRPSSASIQRLFIQRNSGSIINKPPSASRLLSRINKASVHAPLICTAFKCRLRLIHPLDRLRHPPWIPFPPPTPHPLDRHLSAFIRSISSVEFRIFN